MFKQNIEIYKINKKNITSIEVYKNKIFYIIKNCVYTASINYIKEYKKFLDYCVVDMFTANNKIYFIINNKDITKILSYDKKNIKEICIDINILNIKEYIICNNKVFLLLNIEKEGIKLFYYDLATDKLLEIKLLFDFISSIALIHDKIHIIGSKDNIRGIYLLDNNSTKLIINGNYSQLLKFKDYSAIAINSSTTAYKISNNELTNMVLNDQEIHNSGFQITSSTFINANFNTYTIFTTQRRNAQHDKTCFYIYRNNSKQLIKFVDKDTIFSDNKQYTGYFIKNKTPLQKNNQYISLVNYHGDSIILNIKNSLNLLKKGKYYSDKITNINIHKQEKPIETQQQKTNYFITIDVEQHVKNKYPFAITGEGLKTKCGIYLIMDILEKYELKGVFFVNIYEHNNFENNLMQTIIKDISKRGHEVGLHYHPNESSKWQYNITNYTLEQQIEILDYGKKYIENITNIPCISFRAGGYLLNEDTIKALNILNFKVDSSLFIGQKQNINYQHINKIFKIDNIVEFPITVSYTENNGIIDKIDINRQADGKKMEFIMENLRFHNIDNIVTMLHSFSFIGWKRSDKKINNLAFTNNRYAYSVNEKLIKEFENFCILISENKNFICKTFYEIKDEIKLNNSKDLIPRTSIVATNCKICNYKTTYNQDICPFCKCDNKDIEIFNYVKTNIEKNTFILHFYPKKTLELKIAELNINYITIGNHENMLKYDPDNFNFSNKYFNLIILDSKENNNINYLNIIKKLKDNGIIIMINESDIKYYSKLDFINNEL